MEKVKKFLKPIIAIILIAVIGVGGFTVHNRFSKKNAMTSVVFANTSLSERIKKADVKEIITATGTVYLKDELQIFASGDAKVKEVKVEVGDTVKEGQELVVYDAENTKKELEKKIKEAEISLANANLTLKNLTLPISVSAEKDLQSTIDNADKAVFDSEKSIFDAEAALKSTEAKIDQKYIDIEQAEKTVKSNKQLLEIGALTEDEYKTSNDTLESEKKALEDLLRQKDQNEMSITSAKTNLKNNQAGLANAKDKLDDSKKMLSEDADKIKYQQQQNQVALSKLNLDDLKDQLEDVVYNTTSPLNGTVTAVNVERGTKVEDDFVLLKVADFSQLVVKADISEYDVPQLALGQAVTMTSDGLVGTVYEGKVTKIDDSAKTVNSEIVVSVEISVDNVDNRIKPGFSFECEIIAVDKKDVISVSVSSILKDRETKGSYVFTVDESKRLKKTPVELGVYGETTAEVLSGLNEGDEVVSSPTADMHEGMEFIVSASGPGAQGGQGNRNNNNMMIPGMGAPVRINGGGGGGTTVRIRNN